jgi:hypothetical protein
MGSDSSPAKFYAKKYQKPLLGVKITSKTAEGDFSLSTLREIIAYNTCVERNDRF